VVYGSIRGVTKLVGAGIDKALEQLAPLLGERAPGPAREALQAALNGVLGDVLEESGNPLAIPMRVRHGGEPLVLEPAALKEALPGATGRLLLLIHGSSMNDLQWTREGHDHGAALAKDLGVTPLYLHYNSGRHISTNGRELARVLEQLAAAWPVPLEQVLLVTHSMGGLLARSACQVAEEEGLRWRSKLRALVFLGTPHHGAPLERGGAWVDFLLGVSPSSRPMKTLARIRSAGVTDLRYGLVRDDDWQGRDRFEPDGDRRTPLPLPAGVACFAVAASLAKGPGGRLVPGDGLVPVESALGRHPRAELALAFEPEHQLLIHGIGHIDLLGNREVYDAVRGWLAALG
jgi:pimeloyl-ACP methyl ester carboxylesterase